MDKWANHLAVVTGASSGIGATIAKDLVKAGMKVVGLARRKEKIEELRDDLSEPLRGNLHAVYCDVSKNDSVTEAFDHIEKNFGGIDVLVNCAGILKESDTMDTTIEDLEMVMETNFMGAVRCTLRAYKSMRARNFDGHVININSTLGYRVPIVNKLNLYPASKHALNAFTQVIRNEWADQKLNIKATSICPGMVRTDLPGNIAEELYARYPYLQVEDVSQAVIFALTTPQTVQITDLFLRPTGEICG